MSKEYSEDGVEQAAEECLKKLGWRTSYAWTKERFGATGTFGRMSKLDTILPSNLRRALIKLNPGLPDTAYTDAIRQIAEGAADKSLGQINKEKHEFLTKGVLVSFKNQKNEVEFKRLRIFDFENHQANEFHAVRQLEVASELYPRRPDIVCFVNGVPLVVIELKKSSVDLASAYYDNIQDYKDAIPALFHCNAFIVLSNGIGAKVGTVTSPYKFFLEWKRVEEEEEGIVSLDTILRGTCEPVRLLDLFENFLLYDGEGSNVVKIMAKNHQYIGVNKVVAQTQNLDDLKGKLGVFWHTQGSGKSYSMVFLCQKLHRKLGGSLTFLIVVDRTELENQLYDTFTGCGAVTEDNIRAKSRDDLRRLLSENHRYIFTLIHKFSIDPQVETTYPLLADRSNIIVISDEAHRTQGGKFAQNMRFQGLPNAAYLGFTGTPLIDEEDEITKNIFGEYVSVYDFKRAIEDGATLPLRYLNRGEKLGIENPDLDEQMAEIIESEELDDRQRAKLERDFSREYPILTSVARLDAIAKDLVWHFNERGYQGKAMFVALDKPTAVRMCDLVMKYWPEYVSELRTRIARCQDQQDELQLRQHLARVEGTEVCVVVSSEQNEVKKFGDWGLSIEPHRRKMVERDLEKEFKDVDNPFRLAIVCAMWITGFDAPCVSTVYLDKPIKGHTLMQTIARANRVYDDEKENGLIVDYGNVYRQLEKAYSVYGEGEGGRKRPDADSESGGRLNIPAAKLEATSVELAASIAAVRIALEEVGYKLNELVDARDPMIRLSLVDKGVDAVSLNEKTRTQFEFKAREVFRKYKALYPEDEAKPYVGEHNAIEAIYKGINQQMKTADISRVVRRLQEEVNMSVVLDGSAANDDDYIDLSHLDFDRLRKAFEQSARKSIAVYDLQQAIENKLERMVRQNPTRAEFYERYLEIIEEYNEGKDLVTVTKTFDDLLDFMMQLSAEETRAISEGLDEETLAIFDLLKKSELTKDGEAAVKKVATVTLATLKEEKLKVLRWRESTQVTAAVKKIIADALQWLPQDTYDDEEVNEKTQDVYQHIVTTYGGSGRESVYA